MMPRPQRWILTLAAACAAVACGEGASTEPPVIDATSASTSRSGGDVVKLLKRDDQLQGSYFDRLLVDPTEVYSRSLERRPGKLKDKDAAKWLEFTIEHFSGYMVSTGKAGVDIDIDIDITAR